MGWLGRETFLREMENGEVKFEVEVERRWGDQFKGRF